MDFVFKPKVIAQAQSKYSGRIRVVEGWGFKHLSTEATQHSGGIVEEIWQKALRYNAGKNASWLVLGVAGGSVIKIINKKFQPKKITGIEIDPIMIDWAKKYFGLDKVRNLELIADDAKNFVGSCPEKYDFVLADLFGTEAPPEFVYEVKFLKRLKELGARVFINHLYNNPENRNKALTLIRQINRMGYSTTEIKALRNLVILY